MRERQGTTTSTTPNGGNVFCCPNGGDENLIKMLMEEKIIQIYSPHRRAATATDTFEQQQRRRRSKILLAKPEDDKVSQTGRTIKEDAFIETFRSMAIESLFTLTPCGYSGHIGKTKGVARGRFNCLQPNQSLIFMRNEIPTHLPPSYLLLIICHKNESKSPC